MISCAKSRSGEPRPYNGTANPPLSDAFWQQRPAFTLSATCPAQLPSVRHTLLPPGTGFAARGSAVGHLQVRLPFSVFSCGRLLEPSRRF
jgi:hypothetical protein